MSDIDTDDGWEVVSDGWEVVGDEHPLAHLPEGDWRRAVANPNVYLDSIGNPRTIGDGKPYVFVGCPDSLAQGGQCVSGKIPSVKRPGNLIQCPKCKGKGFKAKMFTRVTSWASTLENTKQVELWRMRIVATGYATDPALLAEFAAIDQRRLHSLDEAEVRAVKQEMDALNDRAFAVGDLVQAAQKGTDLHKMAEYADHGEPLPQVLLGDNGVAREVTLQDRADVAAWVRTVDALELEILDVERFVVQDEIDAAGTLDRRGVFRRSPRTGLWCDCGLPKIVDLKTGRVDYGGGKMSQQLAIYANSSGYDPLTGSRSALPSCPHVGVIIHLPHGTGRAEVHTVDLVKGWQAAQVLAAQVRTYRNDSRNWIAPLDLSALAGVEEVA